MDSMIYNKMLHTPIYTGTPGEPPKSRPREKTNDNAFKELLEQRLKAVHFPARLTKKRKIPGCFHRQLLRRINR